MSSSASAALGEALRLRRGEPLAEFAYAGFADAERAHLDELTLVAFEARVGADWSLGRHGEVIGELEALCREHPLRERLWELLIIALYRDGRQAEALRAYTEIRDRLVDELGIDPGAALQELEARVLAQDPTLAATVPARLRSAAGTGGSGKPARAVEQLHRAQCRAGTAQRDGAHLPTGDTGRPRWSGQDPTGGGGGRLTARRVPRRRLAGRAGRRHRTRRGCAGRGRRSRGRRIRPRKPPSAGLNGRSHPPPPRRAIPHRRPRQL